MQRIYRLRSVRADILHLIFFVVVLYLYLYLYLYPFFAWPKYTQVSQGQKCYVREHCWQCGDKSQPYDIDFSFTYVAPGFAQNCLGLSRHSMGFCNISSQEIMC